MEKKNQPEIIILDDCSTVSGNGSTNNTNSNDNNNNDTGIIMTTETKRRKLDPMGQKRPIQFWTTTTTTRTPPPLHGRQRSRIKMEYDDMVSPLDPDSIYSTTTSSGQTTTMYGLHNLNDNNCNNTTTTTTTSVSIGPRTNSFGRDTWWMVDLDGADFRCCGDDRKNHHGNNTTFRVDSTTTTATTATTTTTTRATTMEEEEFITPVPPHRYQGATPLVWCCMKKFGWDEQYARRVLNGYRQYLSLIEQKGNDMAGTGTVDNTLSNLTQIYYPCCYDVDKMWQEHILDTTNYIHDCLLLCGRFVGRTRNLNDCYDNNNSNHHDKNNMNNNNHDDDHDNGTTKSHVTRTSEERDQVTRAALKDLFKSRYDEALWLNQVVVSSTQQNDSKEKGLGQGHEQQEQVLPQEPYLVQPPEAEEEKEETTTREPLQMQIPLSPQLQKDQPLSMQPQTHEAPKEPQPSQDPPTQQQQHTPQRSPPATEQEEEKTKQQQEPLKHTPTKEGKIELYVLDRTTRDTNNKKNKKNDEMEQDQDEEMVEAEYVFKTPRTRPMSIIMNRFAENKGIPVSSLEFFTFGERQIHPNDTPLTLGLGDKDNIVVVSSSSSSM